MPASKLDTSAAVTRAARRLGRQAAAVDFSAAVPWVYNPVDYAWNPHAQYLQRFANSSCRVLFLGMNPGPWGMAQTGVPFGEVAAVRDWLQIDAPVRKPSPEHPKRPIEGLACQRSEVSGKRLWGLFADRYATAEEFFEEHFVANYCPLIFMEASARNVTPDKLPADCRGPLLRACDAHLIELINALTPEWLIGIGAFAENCARRVAPEVSSPPRLGRILHPSPASPAANRDWAGTATGQLQKLGVW